MLDVNRSSRLDSTFMTIHALGGADLFVLWSLRQRFGTASGGDGRLQAGLRCVVGEEHADPALEAIEAVYRVFATLDNRRLLLLPPPCGFITHDEVRLLSLCRTAQAGQVSGARRQARALVGPRWSPYLVAPLMELTRILASRSLRISSGPGAMQRAFH